MNKFIVLLALILTGCSCVAQDSKEEKVITIIGTVKDTTKKPLASEMILMDENMNVISTQNSVKGSFSFSASIKTDKYYNLTINAKGYFPVSMYVSTRLLKASEAIFTIQKELEKLELNREYTLTHYTKNEQTFVYYTEFPPLYSLAVLLQKNPKMKIRIEVHADQEEMSRWKNTFGMDPETEIKTWNEIAAANKITFKLKTPGKPTLSEWRSRNLILDLQKKGISQSRIIVVPSDKQIITNPKTEEEHKQNRAVLIRVISIE